MVDELSIAELRCANKPVKFISKRLGIKRDVIEKIIKKWIVETEPFINDKISGRKSQSNPSVSDLMPLMNLDIDDLLKNDAVLDYIARHHGDYHDRLMDCIRYKIYIKINS
ncbi:hypothetical protein [Picrophilus oshimae]|uniref:Transposase n=1 Tax=Picrophilus torridus (strain ATCC 700027 / DSM 9790 / JCM 10055 / NBRC 100828 / KAW 2/3) TaxID=1122961 RepID=Q6KZA5_PICTO|nr:hypothetical protein [Picrophilus oshimae]AAT43947.1 hypothetical protein PTO1362 [Picrophilus oshimae DSM 9789]SMD30980.1 hypothetical protein SAMN02745355_0898 [Picrophilus oshimae DSM 9789]